MKKSKRLRQYDIRARLITKIINKYYDMKYKIMTPYWIHKRVSKDKQRQHRIMIYDPSFTDAQILDWGIPFKRGESVIYLFEIINMTGHCAVVTEDGKVHWGYHIGDFRLPKDNEI